MEDKTFKKIQEKFNELVFEIQMQDNKKIIEFQQKLKALKEKLALEKELSNWFYLRSSRGFLRGLPLNPQKSGRLSGSIEHKY